MRTIKQASGVQRPRQYCDEEILDRAAGLLQEALSLLGDRGAELMPGGCEEDRLIRLPEVLRLTGMCRSALYEQMSRGQFPRSIKIGPRAASWSAREVRSWISDRIRE